MKGAALMTAHGAETSLHWGTVIFLEWAEVISSPALVWYLGDSLCATVGGERGQRVW